MPRLIFGDQVDYVHSPSYDAKPGGWAEALRFLGLREADRLIQYFNGLNLLPIAPETLDRFRFQRQIRYRHIISLLEGVRTRARQILAEPRDNLFLFLHYPVPHPPSIFDAKGQYKGPGAQHAEGYDESLQFVDTLVGEVVDLLKQAGRYERTLLIVTSDHSLRSDYEGTPYPLNVEMLRHVPLWIKLPHQSEPLEIGGPVYLNALRPFFTAIFENRLAAAAAYLKNEWIKAPKPSARWREERPLLDEQ